MRTVLIAIITAVLTSATWSVFFAPRLEARNRRIQEAHKTRDAFASSVTDLLGYSARLVSWEIPVEASPVVADALRGERDRWLVKLDELTLHLVDDGMQGPMTYIGVFRDLARDFGASARMVWISERPQEIKLTLIQDLAFHAQGIYATAWWRRWGLPGHMTALRQLIEDAAAHRR